jgi:hypothetical protein
MIQAVSKRGWMANDERDVMLRRMYRKKSLIVGQDILRIL